MSYMFKALLFIFAIVLVSCNEYAEYEPVMNVGDSNAIEVAAQNFRGAIEIGVTFPQFDSVLIESLDVHPVSSDKKFPPLSTIRSVGCDTLGVVRDERNVHRFQDLPPVLRYTKAADCPVKFIYWFDDQSSCGVSQFVLDVTAVARLGDTARQTLTRKVSFKGELHTSFSVH
jgi:hypothetical protein